MVSENDGRSSPAQWNLTQEDIENVLNKEQVDENEQKINF